MLGVTTSVVGGLMATEVIKFLTGVGQPEVGKLMMYDALGASIREFSVTHDPARALTTSLRASYGEVCAVPDGATELLAQLEAGELIPLDVREPHEKAIEDLPVPGHLLPTSDLEIQPRMAADFLDSVEEGSRVLVYCASGIRSQWFVDTFEPLAKERGIELVNFPGGVRLLP